MGYGPDCYNAAYHEKGRFFAKLNRKGVEMRPPNAYRVRELVDVTGLTKQTIYAYVKRGIFKEMRLKREHRDIWVTKASVLAWLALNPKLLKRAIGYGK